MINKNHRINLIEQIFNTVLGLVLSFLVFRWIISPIWGFDTVVYDEILISIMFFIISIIRGFIFRYSFSKLSSNQTKIHSFYEQFLNVGTGFLIATLFWSFVVVPLYGFDSNMNDNLLINIVFFIFNMIRSYAVRRSFNWYTNSPHYIKRLELNNT